MSRNSAASAWLTATPAFLKGKSSPGRATRGLGLICPGSKDPRKRSAKFPLHAWSACYPGTPGWGWGSGSVAPGAAVIPVTAVALVTGFDAIAVFANRQPAAREVAELGVRTKPPERALCSVPPAQAAGMGVLFSWGHCSPWQSHMTLRGPRAKERRTTKIMDIPLVREPRAARWLSGAGLRAPSAERAPWFPSSLFEDASEWGTPCRAMSMTFEDPLCLCPAACR